MGYLEDLYDADPATIRLGEALLCRSCLREPLSTVMERNTTCVTCGQWSCPRCIPDPLKEGRCAGCLIKRSEDAAQVDLCKSTALSLIGFPDEPTTHLDLMRSLTECGFGGTSPGTLNLVVNFALYELLREDKVRVDTARGGRWAKNWNNAEPREDGLIRRIGIYGP